MAQAAPAPTTSEWADTKQAWLDRVHDVEIPSGIKVTFRDVSLADFMLLETLPTDLLDIAVEEWSNPGSALARVNEPIRQLEEIKKPTKAQRAEADTERKKRFGQLAELNRELIAVALVEPKLTADELRDIPMPDLEMLSLFVNRQLVEDAAGRRVGVVPINRFRVVLAEHGIEQCDPDCEACEAARRAMAATR